MEEHIEAIRFGRFLLKYCFIHWTKDNSLCWMYEGKEYDTVELHEEFIKNSLNT